MALRRIRLFGDPILRERAVEVTEFDDGLRTLAADMLETMRIARGAGLAANQVGVLKRLFTWELPEEDGPGPCGAWVNPEVVDASDEVQDGEEGCLSFPGLFFPCERPLRVRMRAQDLSGEPHEVTGEELLARVILHEIDHLNGILFIDHLARHDRKEALRRIRQGELEAAAAEHADAYQVPGAPPAAGARPPWSSRAG